MELDQLTQEFFAPYLQQSWRVWLNPTEWLEMTLIEIRPIPRPPFRPPWPMAAEPVNRAPFALLFRGPVQFALPQRIYHFETRDSHSVGDLFIVPIGMDGHGRYYEAVFN